ncbi:signal recognition particle protein [Listeria fleischmannii]|jgi:signal recognition particle subunit SRP54|uniref:Signal recognition particle protein n=2 Tax=Listeria fleischmannii TaxID=1069827 RepID=W7DRQ2_9LIST|nr:signal recognition particle protein [Listeria fleischmannii]EIA19591.1 signal recognition particle protein [Listeria fleischmannii subsp. coloradonensis]EUJ48034.1 signal recognition particle protein [Listeria fleischmannii FSL S10-1203]MBC1399523.1 signal recognition particle protein [Listeria fleischmannii]MBC1428213.1 signal recognition particle protein [Listeria fleischmannii]STY34191.1 Fifty-four homolog [Listeria fleischmannii subsp. coloradonensis]
MAFEGLAGRLQETMNKIRGKGKVSEQDVKEMMREVRLALLEADVNFKVVKNFIKTVSERSVGQDVMKSLTPGQQVIKIVQEELTNLMGGEESKIAVSEKPPTVIMMVGLQGAGKTTTTGKLANLLRKKQNRKPLLVAADIYRPAAIKQLETLGKQLNIPVFSLGDQVSPVEIAKQAIEKAKEEHLDYVIIDTAGRLHIDEELMGELKEVKEVTNPAEILLVVDSMTGQDAVNVAESFNEQLGVTGVVLTKLDGDTRGGAALSIRAVTGKPIKFVGMGEKMEALETFHPDRMASRILGMGDVLSLIEKAQVDVDQEKMREMERKMKENSMTLDDFLEQLGQVKQMGPLDELLKMLPGAGKMKGLDNMQVDDKQLGHIEAIIKSMTKNEKDNPDIINASRRKRIARGSGRPIQEVNRLLKQFNEMKKMMKQMSGGMGGKGKKGKNPFGNFKLPF